MTDVQTPEQIAAAAVAQALVEATAKAVADAQAKAEAVAQAKADKAAAKVAADAVKAEAKAAKAVEVAAAKQAKADAKAAEVAAAKLAKEATAAEAVAAKAAKEANEVATKEAAKVAKEAAKMPEINGIRRPKPDGKCGRAWALMDTMSAAIGGPVAIANLLVESNAQAMNPAMVRSNYAVWRKFNGVKGRVLPIAAVVVAAPVANEADVAAVA